MIAVLGGLAAACFWALTTICYSRAGITLSPLAVLALAMTVGLAVTAPGAVASGIPDALDGDAAAYLVVAGCANIAGLILVITALRTGKVGIVAPIVSTEGAIAAVLAILAGESISPGAGATLAVITAGIAVASVNPETAEELGEPRVTRAALLAIAAAFAFGISLYATGRVSDDLPLFWVLIPARVIGVLAIALPLLLARRLPLDRAALPWVVAAGIGEVIGFAFFTLGARDAIAIAAVLASQFGVVAAMAAYVLFGERLTRLQTAGIVTIAAGVAALTAIQS